MPLLDLLSKKWSAKSVRMQIPNWWNKDWYHFVTIIDLQENEKYPGYIWATDNWIEVHCFAKLEVRTVLKILDDDFQINTMEDIGEAFVPIPSKGIYLQANEGFVFTDRIKSFISPRITVHYTTRGERAKFYSRLFKFRDTIYCRPSDEDFSRWKQWHPNDDYKTVFSGATVRGYYFGEYHQGELSLSALVNDTIYPPTLMKDPYLTWD